MVAREDRVGDWFAMSVGVASRYSANYSYLLTTKIDYIDRDI